MRETEEPETKALGPTNTQPKSGYYRLSLTRGSRFLLPSAITGNGKRAGLRRDEIWGKAR